MIFLLCGPAGIGKSYYIKENASDKDIIISRDSIRFSMLKEGETYFSHEKDVIKEFKRQIIEADNSSCENIWIDATHLTKKSRKQVIDLVKNNKITCIYFLPDIEKCKIQNNYRDGLKKVPNEVIERQVESFEIPTKEEGFAHVIKVD